MKPILKLTTIMALLGLATPLWAQVPQVISYQGYLAIQGTNFSGAAQFKFALVNGTGSVTYWSNDGTSSGGSPPSSPVSVPVSDGRFIVLLGDTTLPHMSFAIPPNVFTNADVRLRLWVSDGNPVFQQLAPDQRLSSSGYAMHSASATVALSVAPGVLTNFGTVVQVNTGAGLIGGPITSNGTISIPNGGISNAMLQNSALIVKAGAGLVGGGSASLGGSTTLSIGNGSISNALLANPSLTVAAGPGLTGGGSVPLGGATTVSANLNHDATLAGNGGSSLLGLNLANANTWTGPQTFVSPINGNVSGTAAGFTGALAGDVTGTQVGTVITNLSVSKISGLFKWQAVAGPSQQAQPNTGYIVTNATLVTLTLPPAPSVGDVVRVSAPGAGGWKMAQNAGQSIFAGQFESLKIGQAWAAVGPTANWDSVASSGDARKLVAVVNAGQIYTSTDSGATWVARETNRPWSAVTSSSDGTKLVATVSGGQIFTSGDSGATWVPRDSSRAWSAVAASIDGAKLVSVVNGGQVYTSVDSGVNWAARDANRAWVSVASSADGTKLVAGVSSGQLYTSSDSGLTWSAHGPGGNWYSVASSSDGSRLVAASRGYQIYTSADSGTNWSPHGTSANWYSVACSADGTRLVAVVNGGQIYTSTDFGQTWLLHENNRAWQGAACSVDATTLVAVVSNGRVYVSTPPLASPATTTTPGTAGYLAGGQSSAVELQYIGNNQFLPLSHEGLLLAY